MPKPWEKYGQPQQAAPQSPPPFIAGTPDPIRQAAEGRAQEDQAMDRERLRLAQEGNTREAVKAAEGSEAERTAGFLTKRIVDSTRGLAAAAKDTPSALGPTIGVELLRSLPVVGSVAANYAADPARQQVRAHQIDILDAALTLGTGAAYTKEQLAGYQEAYFPQLGDDESTIQTKSAKLRSLLEAARVKAGRAAPDIDVALSALDSLAKPAPGNDGLAGKGGVDGDIIGSPDDGLTGVVHDDTPRPGEPGYNPAHWDANGEYIGPLSADEAGGGSAYAKSLSNELKGEGFDPNSAGSYASRALLGLEAGLTDEIEGIGGAVSALFNNEPVGTGYTRARDKTRMAIEQSRGAQGFTGNALEFAGGIATPIRGASQAQTMGQVARVGAKAGALAGFGYGEGATNSLLGAGVGAVGGAVAAPAVNALARPIVNKLASRGKFTPDAEAAETIAAFERTPSIPLRRPDVDPSVRGRVGAVEKGEKGGPVVREAFAADNAAMEGRLAEIGGQGRAGDRYDVGGTARTALERHGNRTKGEASARYQRAEKLSGDPVVEPAGTIKSLADEIVKLEGSGANTNAAEIKMLREIGEDLSGTMTISQLRNVRTNVRTKLKTAGLDRTAAEARVMGVLDNLSGDIEAGLANNPAALAQYKAGDKIWRERAEFRRQITDGLLGKNRDNPLSAKETAANLEAMAKKDPDKFGRVLSEMTPDERADIVASTIGNLGRDNKSQFSPTLLLNNLDPRKGIIDPRSIRTLLGSDGARALADLQAIARSKVAAQTERNTSKTGNVVSRAAGGMRNVFLSGLGLAEGGLTGGIALPIAGKLLSGLGEARTARLLMNPDVTKWLRAMPEATNPKAINAYFGRLEKAAARSPVFLADVKAMQSVMMNAANDVLSQSPGRVAAAENEQN